MLTRYGTQRPQVLGLLDIGSSKVCCVIAERTAGAEGVPQKVRILGIGQHRSQGIKAGCVNDLDQAEAAVRAAVSRAEKMADVQLEAVSVNVSCGRSRSMHFLAHADLPAGYVRPDDISRVREGAYGYAERGDRVVIHLNRIAYLLDGGTTVRQPLRMAGRRLSAQYHAVTVDESPLAHMSQLIERCYLGLGEFLPSGYASALGATTEEERRFGVIVVDIGDGVIDIALIADDRFLYVDVIPFGSGMATFDIARSLSMSLAEAERIKALYGTMVAAASDERQIFSYARAGGEPGEQGQTTKAELRRVLYPRMLGQLKLVAERIASSELLRHSDCGVVLTGGGSQLVGLASVAADLLGRPVRIGGARVFAGMPESLASPATATIIGMIAAASGERARPGRPARAAGRDEAGAASYLGRMAGWLRESF